MHHLFNVWCVTECSKYVVLWMKFYFSNAVIVCFISDNWKHVYFIETLLCSLFVVVLAVMVLAVTLATLNKLLCEVLMGCCSCVLSVSCHDVVNDEYTRVSSGLLGLQGSPPPKKNWHLFVRLITSPIINRFSKLFHYQNQGKICNNTITKAPTAPQVYRYTTLWNVKCLKSNNFCMP